MFLLGRADFFSSEVVLLLHGDFIHLGELLLGNLEREIVNGLKVLSGVLSLLLRIELDFLVEFRLSIGNLLFRNGLSSHHIIAVVIIIERSFVGIEVIDFLILLGLEISFFFFILSIDEGRFAVVETLVVSKFRVSTTEITIVLNLLFFVVFVNRSQNIKDFVFVDRGVLTVETVLVEGLLIQVNNVLLLLTSVTILVLFLAVIIITRFILIFSDGLSIQGESKLVLIILIGSKESGIISLLVLVLTVLGICNVAHLLRNISVISSVNGVYYERNWWLVD